VALSIPASLSGPFCGFESQGILRRMKKARVIVKTVSAHHRIYVEHNGERTLYAETDKLPMAKELVQK
jgi:hypothetical protein